MDTSLTLLRNTIVIPFVCRRETDKQVKQRAYFNIVSAKQTWYSSQASDPKDAASSEWLMVTLDGVGRAQVSRAAS